MAMGYQMLSADMTNLLPVKKALSTIPLETAKKTLGRVLALDSAEAVKATVDRLFRREALVLLFAVPAGDNGKGVSVNRSGLSALKIVLL